MDIRQCTVLIIRKESMFLVGTIFHTRELRWSDSPYDAWNTRSREKARKVAERIGGEILLFNPVVQQMKAI